MQEKSQMVPSSYIDGIIVSILSCFFFFMYTPHLLAAENMFPAFLGNGYDSLRLEHKMFNCVGGEIQKEEAVQAGVSFFRVESWQKLNNQFNLQIAGSIYVKSDTSLGKFVEKAKETSLSATYLLNSRVSTEKQVLSNPQLKISKNDENFRNKCGTQFTSLRIIGGELWVGLKFHFSKKEHRDEFESKGSITSLTGLGAHIDSLNNRVRQKSSMEIFINQIGGEVADLDEILSSSNMMRCSLAHFDQCQVMIEGLWHYATDQFPKAVKEGKSQTIAFRSSDYAERPRVMEDHEVSRHRKHLLDSLDEHFLDQEISSHIKLKDTKFVNCDSRCLSKIDAKITSNIRDIKEAIVQSFMNPEGFLEYGTIEMLELKDYRFPEKKKKSFIAKNQTRLIAAGVTSLGLLSAIAWKFR